MVENDPDVKASASTDNGACIDKACDEALVVLEDLCSKVPPQAAQEQGEEGDSKGPDEHGRILEGTGDSIAFPSIG
jgi:hypothetical protein